MNTTTKPPPGNHDLAFRTHSLQIILSGPIHVQTQHHCGLLRNVTLQLAPSVGMACALARAAVELSFCWTRVYEDAFMTGGTLLLFRHKFPLGATPRNASGMASLGVSNIKLASPTLFEELTFRKWINKQENTSFGQNQGIVWSSDSSLWGNQLLNENI